MSHVTDIILITGLTDGGAQYEHPNADRLNAWLQAKYNCSLKLVNQYAGGNRAV